MMSLTPADSMGAGVQQYVLFSEPAPSGLDEFGFHVGVTHLLRGSRTRLLRHAAGEGVIVVAGAFEMQIDSESRRVAAGDYFVIPAGSWHRFANPDFDCSTMLFVFGATPTAVTEVCDSLNATNQG